jgi:hypothetical protein
METVQPEKLLADWPKFEVSTEIRLLNSDLSGKPTSPRSKPSTRLSTKLLGSIYQVGRHSWPLTLFPQSVFLWELGFLPTFRRGWRRGL